VAKSRGFEDLLVYQMSEVLADTIWDLVVKWKPLARDTVGKQIIRSADSIGANISEGAGRGTYKDNRRCVRIGRGELNETRHWLRRAYRRRLLTAEQIQKLKPLVDNLGPALNGYLRSIGRTGPSKSQAPRPDLPSNE
jgi:four helix bundle protein